MKRTCPHCGAEITRARGNLRTSASWHRAVDALLRKHVASCPKRPKPEFPCERCGYTQADQDIHGDHRLCPSRQSQPGGGR